MWLVPLLLGDLGCVVFSHGCTQPGTPGHSEALLCPPGAHFPFSRPFSPQEGPVHTVLMGGRCRVLSGEAVATAMTER